MTETSEINEQGSFKLGKQPARRDARNLRFRAILKEPIPLPKEYDYDTEHPGIPTPMFGNDAHGDCVIAGRAHQTLRFEQLEQGALIPIADKEVLREYFRETGGLDRGLVVLDSLKLWRKRGWIAAKRRYFIQAFAEIAPTDHDEIRRAIFMDLGIGLGLALPQSAQRQVEEGKIWDVESGPGAIPNSWGGHYVYVPGYTETGPVCVTWGRKRAMTWAFLDKYCDEAFAIMDAKDTPKKREGLNLKLVRSFLKSLAEA